MWSAATLPRPSTNSASIPAPDRGRGPSPASRAAGPDAGLPDADGDGLPDYWNGISPRRKALRLSQRQATRMGDGLTALLEYQNYTDPTAPDTDGDGMNDGAENRAGCRTLPN